MSVILRTSMLMIKYLCEILNMRVLIFILLGLCITPATARPSQTDDDDGQVRESEYEAGDGAEEYIQEEKESLKSDKKRSYGDAEESDDYSEPDSDDPAIKNDMQFQDDPKIGSRDVVKEDHSEENIKEEVLSHDNQKSKVYKRTSNIKDIEPEPDATMKDKLYKNHRDQNRETFTDKGGAIPEDEKSLAQVHEYAVKVCNEKVENLNDGSHDGTSVLAAEKINKKRSYNRDTIHTVDTSDSVDKRNDKKLSRKDLEDLLSSLSIEKVNILKTLMNDNENFAKRDIEKKSNAVDGDKSTDHSRINVRENQEKCHSSYPNPSESESPHNIHSLNTCSPSGSEIKILNPSDMCNLTTPRAELSDLTDTSLDKTQSKDAKFRDDTMDMKNENNKQSGLSDLENIANLESFYDFSDHRNNYKGNLNGNINDYSDFRKFDSELLKRDISRAKHADALMEKLEDSFPKNYEKFDSDSDLEPLVRVKRTESQKYLTDDSKQTCQNAKNGEIENINFATDKMSIGSDTDNILSNNEKVYSTLTPRNERSHERIVSELCNKHTTNLDDDRILIDNDKQVMANTESGSQDDEVDNLENITELKVYN